MCDIEQVPLNVGAEISLVAKYQTIVILPSDILKIYDVMDIGCSHAITMYDIVYSTYCM